jgi:hypothetical protein
LPAAENLHNSGPTQLQQNHRSENGRLIRPVIEITGRRIDSVPVSARLMTEAAV